MGRWARTSTYPPPGRAGLIRITLYVEGGLLAAALAAGWLFQRPFWAGYSMAPGALLAGLLAGLAFLALALFAVDGPWPITARLREDIDLLMPLFRNASLPELLLISVLAGVGEEALFRGVLQPLLTEYIGLPLALILVSLLFGLLHCISIPYVVFASLLGAAFGALYASTGNILVPAVAHASYDFAALVYGVYWRRNAGSAP
ncbi:MAG: CPBP family intramembrane metalloprotease [Candidatus Hydrogenedentes bacterium]|nr:CPBP family intramembrane metalloprotease [Candidatus Hydrogenedentota bacterium]